jgi:hypothetical protein
VIPSNRVSVTCAREIGARAKLVVHERLDGAPQGLAAIEIRLRGRHRFLCRQHVEKGRAHGALNVQTCERLLGARAVEGAFGAVDRRRAKTEVERFP